MQNVPKIVRERLRVAAPAVNHPDPDVLTAFAEHSLTALERDIVLEHLACCGDCRDIVALALPATEPAQAIASPSPAGWLGWPALRWAFVAAGVAAIASFGILQYQKSGHPTMTADNASVPQGAATEASNQPLALPVSPPTIEKRDQSMAPPASALADSGSATNLMVMPSAGPSAGSRKSTANAEAAGRVVSDSGRVTPGAQRSFGPRVANQFQQQNVARNQAPVPPPPAAFGRLSANMPAPVTAQTVEASGAAPAVAQAQNLDSTPAVDQPTVQPLSSENYAYDKIGKAKPALPPGQIGGYVVDPSGAAVSNARITIIPSKTAQTATTVTNSQGAWVIAGLPTGNYKVQAEAPGFATTVLNANYDANQPSMYSLTLNVGSVAETVEVAAQNGQVQTETATAGGPIPSLKVSQAEVSQTAINGRNFTQLIAVSPGPSPLWAITSAGALRRSVDQGRTWQEVEVNANPASIPSATLEVAETSRSNLKDSKKAPRQAAAFTFRTVAAAGAEVWAGGSGGALYHSADAGNHWTRVVPTAAGTVLSGDITSVEFSDAQHGKVLTSTAEVWTTSDSGQTWQKQ